MRLQAARLLSRAGAPASRPDVQLQTTEDKNTRQNFSNCINYNKPLYTLSWSSLLGENQTQRTFTAGKRLFLFVEKVYGVQIRLPRLISLGSVYLFTA